MTNIDVHETIEHLTTTIQEQQHEISLLNIRLKNLESRMHQQRTALIAPKFLTRDFAVWGALFCRATSSGNRFPHNWWSCQFLVYTP